MEHAVNENRGREGDAAHVLIRVNIDFDHIIRSAAQPGARNEFPHASHGSAISRRTHRDGRGSVVLVEIGRGTLTRVMPNGAVEVIAELGGGPNGAAIGPDGKCYVCNNGGFKWIDRNGRLYPSEQPDDYRGGSIQRVDLNSGNSKRFTTECDGRCCADPTTSCSIASGGFWFTDHGKTRPRERDRTGVFYAQPDGGRITEASFPLEGPNGIGLSPTKTNSMWPKP